MAKRSYQWRDPSRLARWTVLAVAAGLLLLLGTDHLFLFTRSVFDRWFMMASSRIDRFDPVFNGLQLALLAPGACWLWGVTANARSLRPEMTHGPVGALVWYVVPIAQLFMPFLVLREVWRASGDGSRRPLLFYWAAHVAATLLGYAGFAYGFVDAMRAPANPLETPTLSQPLWVFYAFAGAQLMTYLLFAWVVIALTRAQAAAGISAVFSDEARPA